MERFNSSISASSPPTASNVSLGVASKKYWSPRGRSSLSYATNVFRSKRTRSPGFNGASRSGAAARTTNSSSRDFTNSRPSPAWRTNAAVSPHGNAMKPILRKMKFRSCDSSSDVAGLELVGIVLPEADRPQFRTHPHHRTSRQVVSGARKVHPGKVGGSGEFLDGLFHCLLGAAGGFEPCKHAPELHQHQAVQLDSTFRRRGAELLQQREVLFQIASAAARARRESVTVRWPRCRVAASDYA